MLSLHNLEKNQGSKHRKKRIGRGNASGTGNYSTRGMKGQRARSGGKSGLAGRSVKSYLLRIPKVRGFKSLQSKMAVVNLYDLEENFSKGATVNVRDMLRADLITSIANGVKVLSVGKLTKELTVEANAFSKAAVDAITKAGGKAVIIAKSTKQEEKSNKKSKEEIKSAEVSEEKTSKENK